MPALLFSERAIALMILILVATIAHKHQRHGDNCHWWDKGFLWLGAFFLVLGLTELAAFAVSFVSLLIYSIHCWVQGRWPPPAPMLLTSALLVGAFASCLVSIFGETVCRLWYAERRRRQALAELALDTCLAVGALMMMSAAWLALESMVISQPADPGLAYRWFWYGLPLSLLWLAPLLEEELVAASKILKKRVITLVVKQRRRLGLPRRGKSRPAATGAAPAAE